MPNVTLKNVAEKADVSIGTVSRVINNHSNVAPDIKKRVENAIEELGYVPNIFAQGIRGGSSKLIGLIVQDITSFPFAKFVQTAQKVLRESNYLLVLSPSYDSKKVETHLLKALGSRKIDGIIMTTCDENDEGLIEQRKRLNVPLVLFDREPSESREDAVLIDHFSGMLQSMRYLLDLGHTRIALITGSNSVYPSRERVRAYRAAFEERQIPIDEDLLRPVSFNSKIALGEASKLLSLKSPPTAIIAGGTALLASALEATQSRGLKIPDDISIIGCSDTPLSSLASPSISTIRWNNEAIGETAAKMLLERIEASKSKKKAEQNILYIPTEFVIRSSCGIPRIKSKS